MLLSIIIPTKNRQYTALYAIESALAIRRDDIEVIVQDCSDSDILRQQLAEKFGDDSRIKYQHTSMKPSMTENWNAAFDRASGEYFCAIGDDDAVLPAVYEIAAKAKAGGISAVTQKVFVTYLWPGFTPQPFDGTLLFDNNYSGKYVVKEDLGKKITEYSRLADPMGYVHLPQAYHCVFSRQIKEQLEKGTGAFLQSTSLDIYSAVAFNKFITSYLETDFPFTIRGACKSSNSQRIGAKRTREHFNEFRNLNYHEILPEAIGLNITAADSLIKASQYTGQEQLIENIDLPILYANIAFEDEGNYKSSKERLIKYVHPATEQKRFYQHYRDKRKKTNLANRKEKTFSFIKRVTPFVYKAYRKLFPIHDTRTVVQAQTIKDALIFLEKSKIPDGPKKQIGSEKGKDKNLFSAGDTVASRN